MEFDISVSQTIKQWPRWKQRMMLVAAIMLLAWSIGFFVWFTFILPSPAASILGN